MRWCLNFHHLCFLLAIHKSDPRVWIPNWQVCTGIAALPTLFPDKGRQGSESLAWANVSLCWFSLQWWQAFKTKLKLKATNWELKPSCAKWNKWNGFPLGGTILLSVWCCLAALSAPISKGALPMEPSSLSFLSCSISLALSSVSFLFFQPRICF